MTDKKQSQQGNQPTQNPVTKISFKVDIKSTVLKEYLEKNTGLIITVYGRIGGLLRMTSDTAQVYQMVKDWNTTNIKIAEHQVDDIAGQVEAIELSLDDGELHGVDIKRPPATQFEWTVNHPIFNGLKKIILMADKEIIKAETLYFIGEIDDLQYRSLQSQVVNMMSGLLERVRKATSPGKRNVEGGVRYTPAQLLKHIRQGGYRLEFFDIPSTLRELSEEYNARYASMKAIAEQRNKKKAEVS